MQFDEALSKLGGFGRYQMIVVTVFNIFFAGNGWQYGLTVFIAGKMDHWCKVPELQHLNDTMQKLIAIPQTTDPLGDTVYKQCSMFNHNYSAINVSDPNIIDTMLNNRTVTEIACNNGWVFDRSVHDSTVVSEFGLICENDWMFTLPGTFQMIGLLIGTLLAGLLSDKFGRRATTLGMLLSSALAIVGGSFSNNFILFLTMRLLSLLATGGAYTSLWILCLEMMPPVHRTHASLYASLFRVLIVFSTLAAYLVRSHKYLQIISACVVIPGLIGVFFLSESPRWLIVKGRYKEAHDICKRIARINKVTLPDDFALESDITTTNRRLCKTSSKGVSVFDLFRTPNMRKRTLIIWAQWFALVFSHYAMVLNVGTLIPGNIYLNNFFVNGLSNLLSPLLLMIILFKMGRRTIILSCFIITGVLALGMIGLLPIKIMALTTTTALCGMVLVGTVFRMMYLYCGEIFPTPARNAGLGSGSSFGRIGGLISPFIPLLGSTWYGLPYLILGIFPLIAGALAFFLPETKDRRLPETFLEAELFGTGRMAETKDSDDSEQEMMGSDTTNDLEPTRSSTSLPNSQEMVENGPTVGNEINKAGDTVNNNQAANPIELTVLLSDIKT